MPLIICSLAHQKKCICGKQVNPILVYQNQILYCGEIMRAPVISPLQGEEFIYKGQRMRINNSLISLLFGLLPLHLSSFVFFNKPGIKFKLEKLFGLTQPTNLNAPVHCGEFLKS